MHRPKIVGILNLTPDSFSDGGRFNNINNAILQTKKMLEDGADIIDIGAESTRPNAKILTAKDEISRLENILPQIIHAVKIFNKKNNKNIETSIDSYHFETIKFAHENGINIINDVSGLIDENIISYIAKYQLTTILMHNLAIHANPEIIINRELNVFDEIILWAKKKISYLQQQNIKLSQLIFDPGIGFAKDSKQSIRIIKNIENYKILGLKIYVGHSRKSFLDHINFDDNSITDRLQKTLLITKYLASKKVDYIRVHDVKENIIAIS